MPQARNEFGRTVRQQALHKDCQQRIAADFDTGKIAPYFSELFRRWISVDEFRDDWNATNVTVNPIRIAAGLAPRGRAL